MQSPGVAPEAIAALCIDTTCCTVVALDGNAQVPLRACSVRTRWMIVLHDGRGVATHPQPCEVPIITSINGSGLGGVPRGRACVHGYF